MKVRKKFSVYLDYWDWFKLLTDEEMGRLLRAIFHYEREGIMPDAADEKVNIFFHMVKEQLDRERNSYEALCTKNKEIALMRWQKTKNQTN